MSNSVKLFISDKDHYEAVIVGCLRQLQGWSMTSIIGEFQIIAGKSIFDLEQFIETFDTWSISLPMNRIPEMLALFSSEVL